MKNYFITTKTKKFTLLSPEVYEVYTIEKNIYRSWIKINLNILGNGQIITAFKLGRKWNEEELNSFKVGAVKGDYYLLYLTRNNSYPNFEYPIFEDKKNFGRSCYKGSINFAFRTSSTTEISFRITYIEESEDKIYNFT